MRNCAANCDREEKKETGAREERVYGVLDEVSLQGLHRDRADMVAWIAEHAQQGWKMRGDASACRTMQLSCRDGTSVENVILATLCDRPVFFILRHGKR